MAGQHPDIATDARLTPSRAGEIEVSESNYGRKQTLKPSRNCSQLRLLFSWLVILGVLVFFLGSPLEKGVGQVHVFQKHPARRVTVVEKGGGYFPVVSKLKNGEIVAVVRGGGPHKFSWGKARLDLVRSKDGGKTWSSPSVAVDTPMEDLNPALGQLSDGTLVLAYWSYKGTMHFESYEDFRAQRGKVQFLESHFYAQRSKDGGRSWDQPSEFRPPLPNAKVASVFGKIVELNDVAFMSMYVENQQGSYDAYLLRSRDAGKTWGEASLIAREYNETALAVEPGGRLVAAMRSSSNEGTAISFSDDGGVTWTSPLKVTGGNEHSGRSSLPSGEHPADLVRLPDGRLLLTYGVRNRPFGVRARISRDGGKTWDDKNTISLAWDAPNWDCGYPSSVLLDNGNILTVYYQVNDLETAPKSAQARAVIWKPPSPK